MFKVEYKMVQIILRIRMKLERYMYRRQLEETPQIHFVVSEKGSKF